MDTSSATEDMTPRSLDTHILDCWHQEHETDTAGAADLIVERMTKDGASAKEIICDHLGIGTFNPDVVLRALVEVEYSRSLSAEDKLVYGAGLTSLTAQCLVTLMDCTASAADAADELMAALEAEDFSALCRHVRNATGLTDSADAALAMLAALPALEEMLPGIPVDAPEGMFIPADLAVIPADRIPCLHNARTHVLAALAEHYSECMEQSGADRRTS